MQRLSSKQDAVRSPKTTLNKSLFKILKICDKCKKGHLELGVNFNMNPISENNGDQIKNCKCENKKKPHFDLNFRLIKSAKNSQVNDQHSTNNSQSFNPEPFDFSFSNIDFNQPCTSRNARNSNFKPDSISQKKNNSQQEASSFKMMANNKIKNIQKPRNTKKIVEPKIYTGSPKKSDYERFTKYARNIVLSNNDKNQRYAQKRLSDLENENQPKISKSMLNDRNKINYQNSKLNRCSELASNPNFPYLPRICTDDLEESITPLDDEKDDEIFNTAFYDFNKEQDSPNRNSEKDFHENEKKVFQNEDTCEFKKEPKAKNNSKQISLNEIQVDDLEILITEDEMNSLLQSFSEDSLEEK